MLARTLRASSDAHHLVCEVAPVTMEGFVVDKKPAFQISCIVGAADVNVNSWRSIPRRLLETDAAYMLPAMRCLLHSKHSGGAPISLDAVGLTVDYWGTEVCQLFRPTPKVSALRCSGSPLRMGLGNKKYVALVDGDRYDVYCGRGKNHFGLPAYFGWESSGCGDVELGWSATVGADAIDATLALATGLTPSALQRVYDAGAKTLKWKKDHYNAADALYGVTVVRPGDWHPVTSVEGSGVIEGSVIVRGVRMDYALANADEGGFFPQVIAEALGLVPGAVQCIKQMVRLLRAIDATSARRRASTLLPRRLFDGVGFYALLVDS
jgi:hypothetical protein